MDSPVMSGLGGRGGSGATPLPLLDARPACGSAGFAGIVARYEHLASSHSPPSAHRADPPSGRPAASAAPRAQIKHSPFFEQCMRRLPGDGGSVCLIGKRITHEALSVHQVSSVPADRFTRPPLAI